MKRPIRYCDGISRRDVLRVGSASLLSMGIGLPASWLSQAKAADSRAKSLIILYLKGGLSTIDTWDVKPDAPAEFRGDFKPIDTNVSGIRIGEHTPKLAQVMDRFSLIRSFTHKNSNHGQAYHYMLTGYHPLPGFNANLTPNNQRPAHGSIIARKLVPQGTVPPYVCLPQMHESAGPAYLGATSAPFVIHADPNAPGFSVPDLIPPLELDPKRLDARQQLLARVDRFEQAAQREANAGAESVSVFRRKAIEMMTSADAKRAFNIHAESDTLRDQYGRNSLGQSCLMARRLVEAGVRCVTIDHTNWDTHNDNFATLKRDLLPKLDVGQSSLFADLVDRGLWDSTMVVISGEFGRTPRINKNAGRDHWGPGFTVAVGGGGLQGGRVVGSSDARAERPADNPYGPEDLSATMYTLLGINPDDEFYTPEGRPVKIANNGRVIRELL